MKFCLPARWQWMLLLVLSALLGRADELPQMTAEQIIKKVMAQSKAAASNDLRSTYSYTKHVVTKELDGDKVSETKEKVFLVQGGIGQLQSMKINGKPISEKEMLKQNKQAVEARQKLTGAKSGKSDENWEQFLSTDLTARYQFTLLRQEMYNSRLAYVLGFKPLPGKLPVDKLIDRALNQMTGTVWVDGKDFVIAKADLSLQSKVALGGIMEVLGALKQFRYSIERVRVDESVWFNCKTKGEYEGRKLWSTTHIRTETESSDFHKVTAQSAPASLPPPRP